MSTLLPITPVTPRHRPPRGPVLVWGNVVVLGWLAVAIALLTTHDLLGLPSWLAVHALLLGAVTNAIVIWSEHFVVVLCRAAGPPPRRMALGLTALNVFVVAVLVGVTTGIVALSGVGGAGIAAIATVHTLHLWRVRRSALSGRFAYLITFYAAASTALMLGAVLGAGLATGGGAWHARLWAAHVHVTLLGWVGLSVLGTLFTLWPTAVGVRIADGTMRAARRSLLLLCAGLVVAVAGLLTAQPWLAVAGLTGYAAGVGVAAAPLVRATLTRSPHGPAAWMLGASAVWLTMAVLLDAGRLALAGSTDSAPEIMRSVLPVLAVGFTAQVLLGALTQLLPVVLGRGPAGHRAVTALLATGWRTRVVALNLAVPLIAGDWPDQVQTAGWALAALSAAAFVVLALSVAVPAALGRPPLQPRSPRSDGTATGIIAAAAVVVLAVSLATSGDDGSAEPSVTGTAQTVDVTLSGMRMQPDSLDVAAGTRLVLRVTNDEAMPHDLRVDSGQRTPRLGRGETALLDLGEVRENRQAWCTVAGHRAAGMTMTIRVRGDQPQDGHGAGHEHHDDDAAPTPAPAPASGLDMAAKPSAGWAARDARLAPVSGTVHRVELHATEQEIEIAPGRKQLRWTFGGSVPGPTLRGRVGDEFEITLVNDTTMGHGIDFHASALAPEGPMRTIAPGERLVYRFRAPRAGAWLYHCSTMPMTTHLANGMVGAVIIDPPDLPAVDREYVLVASQLYADVPGSDSQLAKIREGRPDGWAFNGMAAQYDHAPLTATVGERVRIWLVNAGPGDPVAFHVVGSQFDTVYREGAWQLRPSPSAGGAQVLDLAPAQGGFVELTFPEAGRYPMVDHDMRHAEGGAHGLIDVTG